MDNFDNINPNSHKPDEPIPFDDKAGASNSSKPPLFLGGNSGKKPLSAAENSTKVQNAPSADRITGIKTFFTKLHVGALGFLDEQVANWLKNNPDVLIKRTNTISGTVVGKKAEPNIIITIWY